MIHLVPALLGIGCLAALALSCRRGGRLAVMASGLMLAVFVTSNVLWLHDLMWIMPLVDTVFGVAMLLAWVERPTRLSADLLILSYLRLAAHGMHELTSQAFLIPYIHALNALFAAQLLVIVTPGGINGLIRLLHVFCPRHRSDQACSARRSGEA